jgi:hypothetical protein
MLRTTPDVIAILIQSGSQATAFVAGPEGGAALISIRLVRSVDEAFPPEGEGSVDIVVVDVESLGVNASEAILEELRTHPAATKIPTVAWIRNRGHAAFFERDEVVAVKSPAGQKDRFAQIGQMASACKAGGGDQLRQLAEESLRAR